MFNRQIFRTSSLERMTSPEDLDELLRVNSVGTWVFLLAVSFVAAGFVVWSFLGTVTQKVQGYGVIKTHEIPRKILAPETGQVDTVFCSTGDRIVAGQKLFSIFRIETKSSSTLCSPIGGGICGIMAKEGDYVKAGEVVLEMIRLNEEKALPPEVVFFVEEKDVAKLKTGMMAAFQVKKGGIPPSLLKGSLTFVSDYPAAGAVVKNQLSNLNENEAPGKAAFYEIRAGLLPPSGNYSDDESAVLKSLNGLSCQVSVVVSKRSPASYFLDVTR